MNRQALGEVGERAAQAYLEQSGYRILERNYRCRGGEIDLIALQRGVVAFVEVRRRAADSLVAPIESLDANKRRRIVTAAKHYALRQNLLDRPLRFDFVGVTEVGGELRCELVEGVFDLDDLPRYRRRW